jgi:hypothetical protein
MALPDNDVRRRSGSVACAIALALTVGARGHAADSRWSPNEWVEQETLNLCTSVPEEGGYCFPVWLVVLDGNVYIRLGNKAAERMQKNTTAPYLPVEIADLRFDRVRAVETPDYVDRVAEAMADKYWTDLFIRFFPHPLTMRLEPVIGEAAP